MVYTRRGWLRNVGVDERSAEWLRQCWARLQVTDPLLLTQPASSPCRSCCSSPLLYRNRVYCPSTYLIAPPTTLYLSTFIQYRPAYLELGLVSRLYLIHLSNIQIQELDLRETCQCKQNHTTLRQVKRSSTFMKGLNLHINISFQYQASKASH